MAEKEVRPATTCMPVSQPPSLRSKAMEYLHLHSMDGIDGCASWSASSVALPAEEVLGHIWTAVLGHIRTAGLKLNPGKYHLMRQFLGHVVGANRVATDPAKVEAVQGWPTLVSVCQVRVFLGLASFYRLFVLGFADIARPLHSIMEKGRRFHWTKEYDSTFR
ncbi:Retrovirus-related Pol polyprotein from transposon 17.6 [Acipenser ruthenus]|uniref:Retrovirus-related Pol polyprotein from transposon 17.6 n=1 Tax=Acipenser ruthenus TaxID=7906 RepID=A0A662Z077_ACIRT|nr:Retrovirus-related Pol polyprotein from transposon 17.6 [Acipenser ruthenus]